MYKLCNQGLEIQGIFSDILETFNKVWNDSLM